MAASLTSRKAGWDDGIRVTSICPGHVKTDMTKNLSQEEMTDPEDIAKIVSTLLLLSNKSSIHEILINNHFSPIKYDPYTRRSKKLKIYREDQFNTIYIRDEKFVENRLINSPKYKIGNQYI